MQKALARKAPEDVKHGTAGDIKGGQIFSERRQSTMLCVNWNAFYRFHTDTNLAKVQKNSASQLSCCQNFATHTRMTNIGKTVMCGEGSSRASFIRESPP